MLAHLAGEPDVDPARLAYHASEADDRAAVLRHAPTAAAHAAALGAHREAAAHYARALRYAAGLAPERRAGLRELLAGEYSGIGETAGAIDASTRALALWRQVGDRGRESILLARRSGYLWAAGLVADAHSSAEDAVALVADLPRGSGAAVVHSHLALMRSVCRPSWTL